MGHEDTGGSNNPPKVNEAEVLPNRDLDHPRADESDSDVEEGDDGWGLYMPLAQNPSDGEPLDEANNEDSADDEDAGFEDSAIYIQQNNDLSSLENPGIPSIKPSSSAVVEEVWSKPLPKELDIEMGESKIDLVKQVMSTIQLPSEAIPEWARTVPEDEWKTHLLQRLQMSDK